MFEIHGKQIPATLAELVNPRHTALLLWDMENAIAPNAFNYNDILANLKMLAARAIGRRAGFLFGANRFRFAQRGSPGLGSRAYEARQSLRSRRAA